MWSRSGVSRFSLVSFVFFFSCTGVVLLPSHIIAVLHNNFISLSLSLSLLGVEFIVCPKRVNALKSLCVPYPFHEVYC